MVSQRRREGEGGGAVLSFAEARISFGMLASSSKTAGLPTDFFPRFSFTTGATTSCFGDVTKGFSVQRAVAAKGSSSPSGIDVSTSLCRESELGACPGRAAEESDCPAECDFSLRRESSENNFFGTGLPPDGFFPGPLGRKDMDHGDGESISVCILGVHCV